MIDMNENDLKLFNNFFFQNVNLDLFEIIEKLIREKNKFRIKDHEELIKLHAKNFEIATNVSKTIEIFVNVVQNDENLVKMNVVIRIT